MPVRNPMSRLISFRLSESEFQALQSVCDAQEARSLSDFVRTTVRWIAYNPAQLPSPSNGTSPAEGRLSRSGGATAAGLRNRVRTAGRQVSPKNS